MNEEHKASPSMKKFFNNLLEIKEFVKKEMDRQKNPTLQEIYNKLDKVIKSTEEIKK